MKMNIQAFSYLFLFSVVIPLLLLSSCQDVRQQTITWTEFEPVYMSHEEFVNSVKLESSRDLEKPGKIYFYDGYLFVNEIDEGIHIFDNRDPSNPLNVGFIQIPANKDLAIRNDLLYADSQKDLLVFDISNLEQPELIERVEGVFDNMANRPPGFTTQQVDHTQGLVVGWREVVREEVCEGSCRSHPASGARVMAMDSGSSFGGGSQTGTGGSMARFTIAEDHLYAVDWNDLYTFDLTGSATQKTDHQHVGWMIETIFPYNQNLFVGSANAMYIYDISQPSTPAQLSVFRHATACDPVVVEGNYAYVTLRDGEHCPNITGTNQLEVINVEDLKNPKRIGLYKMLKPHGLGIDQGNLFISEGEFGLKVMDASDPYNIKELRHIKDIETFDVIPLDGVLMVTGQSGILQYDYSDINDLKLLSTIPVYNN
jgi:hypothetical protein